MVKFHWINWAIVLGYLGVIAGVGFWFMHRSRNAKEYFKGGGNIPWWAAAQRAACGCKFWRTY